MKSDNFFSICDASETDETTDADGFDSPFNNSPEHGSTNLGAPRQIGHSKPPLTSSILLKRISPIPQIPVKESTKKQLATILRSLGFTESKNLKKQKVGENANGGSPPPKKNMH